MEYVILILVVLAIYTLMGFRRVPLGAVGVVILLGRRTGETRSEGWTWLPRGLSQLISLYVRERQILVPQNDYHLGDRARISFTLILRVAVVNTAALFDQGPGTYGPFTRDAYTDHAVGSEEANVALRGLVYNSVRESVQSLSIQDVMFGGRGREVLRERILAGLEGTARRWGLEVREVWLTDVDASNDQLEKALEAEVRQSMEGKGELAAYEARVARGALFGRVAGEVAESLRQQLGEPVTAKEVMSFLLAAYRSDRELDIALKAAGSQAALVNQISLRLGGEGQSGPSAVGGGDAQPALGRPAASPRLASGSLAAGLPNGEWVIGREGDLVVEADSVSRRHALLRIAGDQLTLTDLGSSNGTFIGSQRLPPHTPAPLAAGDTVSFGKSVSLTGEQLTARLQSR